jgi:flagellar biosynthesis protein FlhG
VGQLGAKTVRAGEERRAPRVWAIGGGKGGVGKSIVTSSLAIALARQGERCIVIDADLGGANLHTILGIKPPRLTLSHFLTGEAKQLEDVACPGPVPNLRLISGSQALLEMANPSHSRKERLLRHIERLDADHVLLDLGAGSAFNVLDFFLAASRGILVVVPEPTSIENAYHFLKAAFFRTLRQAAQRVGLLEGLQEALRQRSPSLGSPRELLALLRELDPERAQQIEGELAQFRPLLIVNQARTLEHKRIGADIALACREYLGTELGVLGSLERDECVRTAVSERAPVLTRFPASAFARDLQQISERLCGDTAAKGHATREHSECSFRSGRQLYGRSALALVGLRENPGCEAVAEAPAAVAIEASEPELEVASAPELPESKSAVVAMLPAVDLSAPGDTLRRFREARGLSLQALATRLRILCLAAIEREDFGAVPPEPFIRGFVRSYAEALGIDDATGLAAAFVARFRAAPARGSSVVCAKRVA